MSEQQNQTLNYFRSHADDWQSKATGPTYSVIEDRHNAVKRAIAAHGAVKKFLDVGCGTGQLCIEVAQNGVQSVGVDFAPEMVAKCEENARSAGSTAQFRCASVFDLDYPNGSFDAISAQGFIEYISFEQLDLFLAAAHRMLAPGGVLAVGSRNRLFNVHSFNEYTSMENELGFLNSLIQEALLLQQSKSQQEAIEKLNSFANSYGHPVSHPETGIKVATRYQYAPSELVKKLASFGLSADHIYPVNFHAFPTNLLNDVQFKTLYEQLARLVSASQLDPHQLLPYASSLVVSARKV